MNRLLFLSLLLTGCDLEVRQRPERQWFVHCEAPFYSGPVKREPTISRDGTWFQELDGTVHSFPPAVKCEATQR